MTSLYLRLALPSPLRRTFDYLPPTTNAPATWQPGIRLRVPFGNRQIIGVLIGTSTETEVPEEKLKAVSEVLDQHPILPASTLQLCQWTAQYYHHSLGDTLQWALPTLLRQGEVDRVKAERFWRLSPTARIDDPRLARAPRQRQALSILAQHPTGLAQRLVEPMGISSTSLNTLLEKGLVRVEERLPEPKSVTGKRLAQPELALNAEQQIALDACIQSLGRFQPFLLMGVTGSGKTEVYLQLIHRVLQQNKQALVLIPEINLSPQTLQRFQQRFNARIVLLHSGLNDRERLDAWLAARDGHADIVIGTRSALFTPLARPGVIIIDEEHDTSYKQQDSLRYHARDVALVRARQENTPILLGSATPSLESLHNAHQGRYGLLTLKQRAGQAKPPVFHRLDIRSRPLNDGISAPLEQAMRKRLEMGQQVLVFLNRRGFAPVLMCHDCGWMSLCPRCDARMTLHRKHNEMRCHHCGEVQPPPLSCPTCHKVDLRPVGTGTERAEERLRILFPDTPILRIDRDSTQRKGAMDALYEQINRGAPCILIGTQMLAKGHHFPRVTLVAILDADGGLFSGDFRASERMAQLITQVAGRAGRAEHTGEVIIQTHLADHPLLVQLTEQGYAAFAEQALAERRACGWPPYSHLTLLRAEAHQSYQADEFLDQAYALADNQLKYWQSAEVDLLGPVPAPMERRAGRYRGQLLLQSPRRPALHALLEVWLTQLEQLPSGRRVRWSLDVDPIDLF